MLEGIFAIYNLSVVIAAMRWFRAQIFVLCQILNRFVWYFWWCCFVPFTVRLGLHLLITGVSVFLGHVREISKSCYFLRHFCLPVSVRPHGTTRLQLGWFSWNLIFEYFSKICRDSSIFIKIWRVFRVLYRKNFVYSYFAEFLRMRIVSDNCGENQNKHFMFSKFLPKIVPFMK
jgi:hypothetical protein